MSKEEILQAGITAARLGGTTKAASLFAQVVKIDPSSEQGWLWLGKCCSAPDQREYCFRRVLALNPNNLDARQQLQRLSKPASPPARVSQSPQAEIANVPKPAPPVAPPVAPIKSFDESVSVVEDELPSPATTETPLKIDATKKSASQRKKRNNALFVLLGFVPTLIICGVAGAYFFLSGQMTRLLSPGFPAIQTPLPPATITITPSAASSPTPAPPTAIPSPIPTISYTPLFENAPCQFETFGSVDVNCGYLIVPEDRTGDPSHTIRLAVAVYKSTGGNPEPEPVMFLQGGPGAEAVQLSADAYSVLVYPFLAKHDFIVFDQRGTGISEPALGCEELTKTYSQDIHGLIPGSTRELVYSNAFLSCNGLMSAQGVNLNAYTTVASAADIKDLLAVLGYQKANLYGASYGTRLAQVVMRDYPEIVHTAILDSVVPVESSLFIVLQKSFFHQARGIKGEGVS
ncbi:MAG: alpha/beta fold hydrolase [Chloroflexi bacterium]|nr:alpha/beta fold hydrolase [Chloroflexota bacterium]